MNNVITLGNQKGFTLLEALIALFVLTIGVLGMMTMQTNAVRGNFRASTLTRAASVASSRLEDLRNRPYNDALLDPTASPFASVDQATGYPVTWTVALLPGATGKRIVVTVNRTPYPPVRYEYIKF